MQNNKTLYLIFRNSGKDYNDLGRYEDCLELKNYEDGFRYIVGTVSKAFHIPMSLGLCLPKVCTVQDFNNFKPYLVEEINKYIPEIF